MASPRKTMGNVAFQDAVRKVIVEFMPQGTTINTAPYLQKFQKLCPTTQTYFSEFSVHTYMCTENSEKYVGTSPLSTLQSGPNSLCSSS